MDQPLLMLDLDGTLLDTSQLLFAGVPPVVYRHLGLRVTRADLIPLWGQLARNFFIHFANRAGMADSGLIELMYAEFEQFYNQHHNDLSITYDDVDQYLPELKGSCHAIGVVTNRPTSRSKMIYQWPWAKHLDFIVWGDEVKRQKPAPDGLNLAMQKFGPSDGRGIYVGDNPQDIRAAKACRYKITSVAGLWGAVNPQALLSEAPDRAFGTFKAFSDWITHCAIELSERELKKAEGE